MQRVINDRKVAIVGCGFVGSATAFALMQSELFTEMVLIDVDRDRAEGEALDIAHGMPFAGPMNIYAGDYDDAADAAIIIVTAGANQQPGETRLDLVHKNVSIFKSIIPEIAHRDYQGLLLVVSNPVDALMNANYIGILAWAVVLGIALSAILCQVLGTGFSLSYGAIALGVGFSAAVGVLFGWSPARKASRLNPIDALHRM